MRTGAETKGSNAKLGAIQLACEAWIVDVVVSVCAGGGFAQRDGGVARRERDKSVNLMVSFMAV